MKQEIFFIKLLSKILEQNENSLQYFLYSIKYVEKILIIIYYDCARIYTFNQFDDSILVKSYYTEDYSQEKLNSEIYEFNDDIRNPQNKINFQKFIKENPMDNKNSKFFEKEYKYDDL